MGSVRSEWTTGDDARNTDMAPKNGDLWPWLVRLNVEERLVAWGGAENGRAGEKDLYQPL